MELKSIKAGNPVYKATISIDNESELSAILRGMEDNAIRVLSENGSTEKNLWYELMDDMYNNGNGIHVDFEGASIIVNALLQSAQDENSGGWDWDKESSLQRLKTNIEKFDELCKECFVDFDKSYSDIIQAELK